MTRRIALGLLAGATAPNLDFGHRLLDYSHHLAGRSLQPRERTDYLIIHCTADPSFSSLKTLLSADRNAHYLIERNGDIVRLVPDTAVAAHAGYSRWHGQERLNAVSVGIEFEGLSSFTDAQYQAFSWLYQDNLKRRFNLNDSQVLYHRDVAYCPSESVHRSIGLPGAHTGPHRGRKQDPLPFSFDRERAGLGPRDDFDSDVALGHVLPAPSTLRLELNTDAHQLTVHEGDEILRYPVSCSNHMPAGAARLSRKEHHPYALVFTGNTSYRFSASERRLVTPHASTPYSDVILDARALSQLGDTIPYGCALGVKRARQL